MNKLLPLVLKIFLKHKMVNEKISIYKVHLKSIEIESVVTKTEINNE